MWYALTGNTGCEDGDIFSPIHHELIEKIAKARVQSVAEASFLLKIM